MSARIRYAPVFILLYAVFSGSSLLNGAGGKEPADGPETVHLDPHFRPHLGTSYYKIELNRVDIGTGQISMQKEGNLYRIRYQARTNRKVDHVYRARYRGEGIMETDPLKPVRAELHQRVRSKTKETTIYFEENGRIITTETKTEEGKETDNEVRETRSEGSALDPLSAIFLLQGIEWEQGKEKVLEVFTGKSHYEARFVCVDEVSLEISGTKKRAWVINHTYRNLDEKKEEQPEQKEPWLKIYVSSEEYPDVLKVETTRKIGHITFTLDRFEPAPDQ
ncbi:MAG TPA: DUF3108 domain-containing protein [Deltaproteobacteria bacterium]|jgi:hypothetical protein|nr:DUF3108 domain-containing protein [Deltaproteobacteria bacterium]